MYFIGINMSDSKYQEDDYVDNKITEYEKVNNTFIGFYINEGYHDIKIVYTSPYLFEGMIVSISGYLMFLPIIYNDIFKKKRVKK